MDTQQIITSQAGVQKIGIPVSTKFPQVKGQGFNLRDNLNDVLFTEKHNLVSYQTAINEMVNDDLRQLVINNRNDLQNLQVRFFNELFNLGEYQENVATQVEINDASKIFTGYMAQFPSKQQQ